MLADRVIYIQAYDVYKGRNPTSLLTKKGFWMLSAGNGKRNKFFKRQKQKYASFHDKCFKYSCRI